MNTSHIFTRGLSYDWVTAVAEIGIPSVTLVGLAVAWYQQLNRRGRRKSPQPFTKQYYKPFGLNRRHVYRGLKRLEAAGLVEYVAETPNSAPVVWTTTPEQLQMFKEQCHAQTNRP